jgi:hypothetical protein
MPLLRVFPLLVLLSFIGRDRRTSVRNQRVFNLMQGLSTPPSFLIRKKDETNKNLLSLETR